MSEEEEEEIKTEFIYTLLHPFEYHSRGSLVEAKFITLYAPTTKHVALSSELKEEFFKASHDADADDTDAKFKEPTGSEIILAVSASKNASLEVILDRMAKLICKGGIAAVDGEERMTKDLFEKMKLDDFEELAGEYMATFILASSFRKMNELS
jgi:hypothetical protein